jgi:periplasmic divalent cation tolerance protein
VFGIQAGNEEFLMTEGLVVLCTCPDDGTAERIARELVTGGLAACVSRNPVRSTYRWEGALRDEAEVLLVAKTTRERYEALERRLAALHPYEVPEIIALPVLAGSASYLAWLTEAARPRSQEMRPAPEDRQPPADSPP